MKRIMLGVALASLASALAGPALAADTIKIAYIDPLTGAFADIGDSGLKTYQDSAARINAEGGVLGRQLEILGFDNKIDPKESLIQFQKAIDAGARIITQGNGSSVAGALIDAVNKYNERNPTDRVLFLNYAAVDPAFGNDKCSFWHFRFDADSDMKMQIMTDWLKNQADIKKVYIIGQDYSFGKAVAATAVKMLAAKRPDIEIVGNELHPLGKVKDFLPYVAKIKASGAQAVITGNWGNDLTLLLKTMNESGVNVPVLTYYATFTGTVAAVGDPDVGKLKVVAEMNTSLKGTPLDPIIDNFRKKYPYDWGYLRIENAMRMTKAAIIKANSTDAVKVATAMEGLSIDNVYGKVTMRADNHQVLQPMLLMTLTDKTPRPIDGTDHLGWKTDEVIAPEATSMATTCKMERPTE
jgi:branched-chain amino acid transport system substrate-binding protein